MTTLDFQLLYEFNAWANARTRQAVESLPEEQLYVDMKNSFGSIHGTLIHLCGAEDIWLQRLTATEPYKFMLAKDFPTYNSVKKKWSEVESGYAKFISTLTEQKLNEDLIFKTMKGDSVSQKVWMALQHLVEKLFKWVI